MTVSGPDPEILKSAAFDLFLESFDGFTEEKAIEKLKNQAPGFSHKEYRAAWLNTLTLFDNACKLVFRWSTDKPPGTTFELPDENRVFLDELKQLSHGYTDEQYLNALEYGFRKAIF